MRLILFFNGWGMDNEIFSKIQTQNQIQNKEKENFEVIYINYPYEIPEIHIEKYSKIDIVAWSFGVYYCNKFLSENKEYQKYNSIAINGTPEMIGKYGILEKMMKFTLETLTKESLKKFYSNMGDISNFVPPKRSIESLKDELKFFIDNYKERENYFNFAIISERDKIVPMKNQERYFNEKAVPLKKINEGHFCFSDEINLIEIVKKVSA